MPKSKKAATAANGGRMFTRKFKLTKDEREKLIDYLEELEPVETDEHRDKAMLLVMLSFDLAEIDVSELDLADLKEHTLLTGQRQVVLPHTVKKAIYAYLIERLRTEAREFPDKSALFIDYKGRRITPGQVRAVLQKYIDKLKEDNEI